jgi:nitrogen-specific signal transduction histidine kinase
MAMATDFAPAERAPQDEILRQHDKLVALFFVHELLDAVPNMAVILNEHRQIVFANRAFKDLLGARSSSVLGRRPGEIVGCVHATLTPGGCGTTPFCRTCGSVNSIVNSQRHHALDIQECRMIIGEEGSADSALDLRVWSNPLDVLGEVLTVFSMVDISDEKRREALERIFFHDVLNTAGSVKGLADLMSQPGLPEAGLREVAEMVGDSAGRLVEEISSQRALSAAENGELKVSGVSLHSRVMLDEMIRQFHSDSIVWGKAIVVEPTAEGCDLVTDPVLLRRVLTNLIKNALEAVPEGSTVTLDSCADGDTVCLSVQNGAVMPPRVQSQIFTRSFSTKGSGLGLGTYSVKLLTERYLGGQVSFVSSAAAGTRFTVRLPRQLKPAGSVLPQWR